MPPVRKSGTAPRLAGALACRLAALRTTRPARLATSPDTPRARAFPRELDARLLDARLDKLGAALHALAHELEAARAGEDHKQGLIDKLHAELQAHKQGLVREAIKPCLMTLIQMHDALGRMADQLRAEPEQVRSSAETADLVQSVQEDFELAMGYLGLRPFTEPGARFVPARQTSLGVTATSDPALVGTLAARLRPGFTRGEDLLCKERVRVYALQHPQATGK